MELNYKAINVAKAEKAAGCSFFNAMAELQDTPSVLTLLFLLQAGGLTEEEAGDYLDKYGVDEAAPKILDAMSESGFLKKVLQNRKASLKKLDEAVHTKKKSETSPATGESKK